MAEKVKTTGQKHTRKVSQRAARIKKSSSPRAIGSKKRNRNLGSKSDALPDVLTDKKTAEVVTGSDLLLAQEDLRWSEKRYRKIFDQSRDGIMVLEAEQHHILDLNDSMANMFGYTRDELLTRPMTDIWPDKFNQVVDLAQSVISGTQVIGVDLACETRSGRSIRMEVSASFIDFNSIPSILCVVRDNTERKQAEEALRESEERFRSLSEAAFEGIVITRQDKILDANKALSSILGYKHEELIGKEVSGFVAPKDKHLVLEHFRSGSEESYEHRAVRKDGTIIHLEIRTITVCYKGQKARMTAIRDVTERKQAEIERRQLQEKLIQSEGMLNSIVKAIPDIIYRLDHEGKITFVNDAVRRYGYEPEELLGVDIFDLVHPEDLKIATNGINERRTGDRRTTDLEIRLFSKNHTAIPFDVRDSIVETPVFSLDAEGQYEQTDSGTNIYKGTQGVARDITQRKRANEEIRKLSLAVEQSPASVMITDTNGAIEYVNPAFLQLTGYTAEEVLGKNPRILKSGVQPKEFYDDLWATITAGKKWRGEFCNKKKSGEPYWELATISPIMAASGEITHYLALKEDLTQRKQAEEALLKRQERYNLAMQAATDGLWDWNVVTGEAYFSPRYFTMLGYDPDELPASYNTWKDLIHPDERENIVSTVQHHIESKSPKFEIEFRLRTRSGDYRWILSRGMVVANEADGVVRRVIGTHVDITDRKETEAQLRHTQKMEAIGSLAGGIAHDFNNHIMAIMLHSDMLLIQLETDDPRRKIPQEIISISKKSALLTRQLLTFGANQDVEMVAMNLAEVIYSAQNILQRLIRENIEIRMETDSQLGTVILNPGQIEQVLLNLVLNARDAMPDGGVVTISTINITLDASASSVHIDLVEGHYVLLQIRDTGTGIPAEHLDRIFEPFFTTKAPEKGTGLGLSTVYGIVQQSKGVITVESSMGRGTIFKVYFPVVQDLDPDEENNATDESPESKGETILLVEDEESLRDVLALSLELLGYKVIKAPDAQSALEISRHNRGPIDLLITDVIMPGLSGIGLAEQMLEVHQQLGILFISGHTRDVYIPETMNGSPSNFLQKPFTPKSLNLKIRKILDTQGD